MFLKKNIKEKNLVVDPTFTSDLPYTCVKDSQWVNRGEKMIKGEFPLQIDLELNLSCNLNCIMCVRDTITEKKKIMSKEDAFHIIEECGKNGMESIKLQYRGEPLMYPYIIEVIRKCKEVGLYVHLNTNGTLLTDKMIGDLIESKIDKIIISVESTQPKVYEAIRKGGLFKILLHNIKRLKELKRIVNSKTPTVEVFATIHDSNRKEIESGMYHLFWRLYVDSVTVAECFDLYDNSEDDTVLKDWNCAQIWQRLIVLINGDVIPCCVGIDYKDNLVYALGNVFETPLKEIWNSFELDGLRRLHSEGKSHTIEMCRKCRLRKMVISKLREKGELDNE